MKQEIPMRKMTPEDDENARKKKKLQQLLQFQLQKKFF